MKNNNKYLRFLFIIISLALFTSINAYNASSAKIYFDIRNLTAWEKPYLRIGNTSNNSAYSLSKVDGTQYLYATNNDFSNWNNYEAFSIANSAGWTGSNSIYQPWNYSGTIQPNGEYAITKQTTYIKSHINGNYYICPTGEINNTENNCTYYIINSQNSLPQYTVTYSNNTSGGNINVVKYTSSTATNLTSGTNVNPTQIIKVTLTPYSNYDAQEPQTTGLVKLSQNGNVYEYYVISNATITASFAQQDIKHNITVNYVSGENTIRTSETKIVGDKNAVNIDAPNISGYNFSSWSAMPTGVKLSSSSSLNNQTISITATQDATITANYTEDLSTGWYLTGDFNGWDQTSHEFIKPVGGATSQIAYVMVSLDPKKSYTDNGQTYKGKMMFKLKNGNNWYGSEFEYTENSTSDNLWSDNNNNKPLIVTKEGTYIFKLDYSGTYPSITIYYPYQLLSVPDGTETGTIEYSIDQNKVKNIYPFSNNTTLTYSVVEDNQQLANGQSGTITLSEQTKNYKLQAKITYGDKEYVSQPEYVAYYTIYKITIKDNTNQVSHIYTFNGTSGKYNEAFPGELLDENAIKAGDRLWVYDFKYPLYDNIILTDDKNYDNNGKQTDNIEVNGNMCITVTSVSDEKLLYSEDCVESYTVYSVINGQTFYSNAVTSTSDSISFFAPFIGIGTIYLLKTGTDGEQREIDASFSNSNTNEGAIGNVVITTIDDIDSPTNWTIYGRNEKYTLYPQIIGSSKTAVSDNTFVRFSGSNKEFTTNPYTHYCVDWIGGKSDLAITATVGNNINHNLAQIINSKDLFPNGLSTNDEGANVRFAYNPETNYFSLAAVAGASYPTQRFLMMYDEEEVDGVKGQTKFKRTRDTDCKEVESNEYVVVNSSDNSGGYCNAVFNDVSNWIYSLDVKATGASKVKIVAFINEQEQFLFGDKTKEINLINDDITQELTMRVMYDFKTNRLISAWIPDKEEIEGMSLEAAMMITREGSEESSQVKLKADNSIENIEQIYTMLEIKAQDGIDLSGRSGTTFDENYMGVRSFFLSLPYDCNISDVFGLSGRYGETWGVFRYDGEKRAKVGWFSDTGSFWTMLGKNDIMQRGEGYVLQVEGLNLKWENKDNPEPRHRLYFPSNNSDKLTLSYNATETISVPHYEYTGPTHSGNNLDHKKTDCDWNFIGVPTYVNAKPIFEPNSSSGVEAVNFYYDWNTGNNSWKPSAATENFKSTFSYMFQWYGTIRFTTAVPTTPTLSQIRSRMTAANDDKPALLKVELLRDDQVQDHTFIQLFDGATEGFDAGYDMTKIENSGDNLFTRVYSSNGQYADLAANNLPLETEHAGLLLTASKTADYTFHKSESYDHLEVTIYDRIEDRLVDLDFADYTVTLAKGDYTDRFVLNLKRKQNSTTTDVESTTFPYSVSQVGGRIFIGGLSGTTEVYLYDLTGKLMQTTVLNQGESIAAPQNGVYLLQVSGQTQKLIINNQY